MKKVLIAAGALLAASAAVAQVPPPPMKPIAPMARGDGVQTRAEVVDRVRAMFARMDADRDGFITQNDRQAMKGQKQRLRGERRADPARRMAMFERLDTNRDNMISRDEFARAQAMRGERGPRGAMNGRRMGMQRMGGGMMRRADANGDRRISLAEAETAALQRFDRADRNRDGRVTQDERQQVRQQWQQQRPAPVR